MRIVAIPQPKKMFPSHQNKTNLKGTRCFACKINKHEACRSLKCKCKICYGDYDV